MKSITDSTLRNSLPAIMDSINQEHSPIMVTRENGKPVVIMSLDDFKSYEATAHLMSSGNNVERMALHWSGMIWIYAQNFFLIYQ